ncbi:hypothetical protein JVT61DRAFT_15170 [Boletus reticuloceps]|uniref:Transcription activator of gluconeogenesis ERT1 n=1 Tax=Boletus reticuloceps TaxID=495285 RepID=A0A8I2YQU4_9AGAM|nr:hypothetical protein JVT61DRAFT_15170 [Boletus reticuloceps]
MANDHPKNTGPVAQEHPYPPAIPPYAQPLGAAYPPGYPIYYAQPPDSSHGENTSGAPPGPQYMIPFPAGPGMMYPYPPPPPGQGFPQYPQSTPAAANGQRAKRKQVKMACTNCANACKRCDEGRPCERCIKYGIQDACVDGIRKERQKGIKRGPYKRKSRTTGTNTDASFVAENGDSDWQATSEAPQNPGGSQPPPPIQALPHYPPPPEGFYPYFYPPPPGFMPPGHEGQSSPEGATNGTNHPPPMVPYYPLAPPGFFPHYAVAPGAFQPPSNGTPVAIIDPAEASRNAEAEGQGNGMAPSGKKRARAAKSGEAKPKKQKAAATTQESPTSGGTAGGSEQASEPGANSPAEHDD